jgi:hypothetical protein
LHDMDIHIYIYIYIYIYRTHGPLYIVGGIVKTHCIHSLYIPTNYTHRTFPVPHVLVSCTNNVSAVYPDKPQTNKDTKTTPRQSGTNPLQAPETIKIELSDVMQTTAEGSAGYISVQSRPPLDSLRT